MGKTPIHSALLFAIAILAGCAASIPAARTTTDDLRVLDVDTLEYLAVHPGADLASFSKVFVEPVKLEFRDDWKPVRTGSNLTISRSQLTELKSQLEAQFMERFKAGLQDNPRIEIVDQPAPRVLRITPRLTNVSAVNIFGNAMPAEARGMRKLGRANLELKINDVRTGLLVVDMKSERDIVHVGRMSLSATRTRDEFGKMFQQWGDFVGNGILNLTVEEESK